MRFLGFGRLGTRSKGRLCVLACVRCLPFRIAGLAKVRFGLFAGVTKPKAR